MGMRTQSRQLIAELISPQGRAGRHHPLGSQAHHGSPVSAGHCPMGRARVSPGTWTQVQPVCPPVSLPWLAQDPAGCREQSPAQQGWRPHGKDTQGSSAHIHSPLSPLSISPLPLFLSLSLSLVSKPGGEAAAAAGTPGRGGVSRTCPLTLKNASTCLSAAQATLSAVQPGTATPAPAKAMGWPVFVHQL